MSEHPHETLADRTQDSSALTSLTPPRLSAALMLFNERARIDDCLACLGFCDEIVVVDDMSNDGSWEHLTRLAEHNPKLRVFQRRHVTFADQRTFAKDQTRGEWVLTLDADERVSPGLARAIRACLDAPPTDVWELRMRTPYPIGLRGEHWSWRPRLVRREKNRWIMTDNPHSPLDVRGLKIRKLRVRDAVLEHQPGHDLATTLRKAINRAWIQSEQLRARGRRPSLMRLLFSRTGRFLKLYFREGGWRHGRDGFLWASLGSFEASCKYLFLCSIPAMSQRGTDGGPGSYPEEAPLTQIRPYRP